LSTRGKDLFDGRTRVANRMAFLSLGSYNAPAIRISFNWELFEFRAKNITSYYHIQAAPTF